MTEQPRPRRRRVCAHGAKCKHCKTIADGRTVFTTSDGKPHPYPHRHFICRNTRCPFLFSEANMERIRADEEPRPWFWNVTIPREQRIDDGEDMSEPAPT